ncbi:hypothetical protein KALB_968 [Kutzneria albida DSM 43870]|uniref:Uncharacterized protein n=2 Tax=Kutzneria TaxID=43356 RepID=W5W1C7_9PSEU|nr:hypothetical protein KALB_968 [Kutzneria albida DSM 43870]
MPMSDSKRGIRLFRRRNRDDLLERSFVECADCAQPVYVFAETCRGCGHAVELRAG